jgi:hypothetical protein
MTSKSPEIDIIQRPFDRKHTKEWDGSWDKNDIFFQMYIQEKYKNIVYHVPFSSIGVYLENYKSSLLFNFGEHDNSFSLSLDTDNKKIQLFNEGRIKDYKPIYKKYINKLRNTSKRFVIFNAATYIKGTESSHAITILYDKITNELELFQRNPGKEKYMPYEEAKTLLLIFFKDVFGKKVKPVYNNSLCVKAWDISNLCKAMHFEFYEKLDGDCMIWALWYLELRLKNKDIPRRQVLARTMNIFTKSMKGYDPDVNLACKVILGYRKFIDDFTDQFKVVKTSRGSAIRIDKKKTTPLLAKAGRLIKTYLFLLGEKFNFFRVRREL